MIKYKVAKQKRGFCGPASLKIILDYYSIFKTQDEWAKLSESTKENGVQNEGMAKAIEKVGFIAKIIKEVSLNSLRNLIREGKTFLVIWWSGSEGHYSPVVNVTKKNIILADPELGRYRKMSLKNFDHLWFDFAKDYERSPKDLELRTILLIEKPANCKAI